jgi:hypothetical protein
MILRREEYLSMSSSDSPPQKEEVEKPKPTAGAAPSPSPPGNPPSSSPAQSPPKIGQPKDPRAGPSPPSAPAPGPTPVEKKESDDGQLLFHFAECTNCHHILPISTNTEKYFPILSKDPRKPKGIGETCMRCGADSWVLVVG